MLLSTSCFYWPPKIYIEDENNPPEILHSDPAEGLSLQVTTSSSHSAFIVVQDIDPDDSLRFQWFISGIGILGPGEALLQDDFIGSKIELNNIESSWHNRSLNCVVYDSENESATMSWTIEILEEN
jgi:hypothetical protein